MKTRGYWRDDRYDGRKTEMEKCTFDRRPEKNKLLNNCLRQITAKARENGGLNIVQNWREMRDKECIFLISCITADRASLMTAPVTGDIVCVCHGSEWWTHWMLYKCFTSCLCCNITTATAADTVLKYFWNTAQLLLQVSACIRYIHTQRPLAFYAFNRTKFALRYLLLYVVYTWQKSFNYIDAFNYYKQQELSWCWQTCATRLEVSQGHQT